MRRVKSAEISALAADILNRVGKNMKDVFVNPVILAILFGIITTYFFLAFKYLDNRFVAKKFEDILVVISLLILGGASVFPFSRLTPYALVAPEKSFSSAAFQICIYIFVLIVLRHRFRDFFQNSILVFKDLYLTGLLILALLSTFWSETPIWTLNNSLVLVAISLFAVHLAAHYSIRKLDLFLRWFCAIIIISSTILAIAVPSIGVIEKGWTGIMPFPIRLGTCAALGIALWFSHAIYYSKERKLSVGIILLSLLVLIQTHSAQAIFVLLGLSVVLLVQQFFKRLIFKEAIIGFVVLLIFGIPIYIFLNNNASTILALVGKSPELTGRTEFWPQLLDLLNTQRPVIGFGISGFWQPWRGSANPALSIVTSNGFSPPHAHNGFLDLALELGWLGFFLFACSILKTLIKSVKFALGSQSNESITPLILVVYVIMANISESQLITSIGCYIWFTYIFLVISLELNSKNLAGFRGAKNGESPE